MKLRASVIAIAIAAPAAANPVAPDKADRKELPAPAAAVAPASGARRPPPPPLPKAPAGPPAEVAVLGKELAGAWSCKGVMLHGDGSSQPLQASLTARLDLDAAWLVIALAEKAGPLKFTAYRTYEAASKQWRQVQLVNTTAHVLSTSPGERGGKWMWTGTATTPAGAQQLRDYEQRDGKQLRLWGEAQLGDTWQKTYDVTCKQ